MNFKLTSPCTECPFLKAKPIHLQRGRRWEIYQDVAYGDMTFTCHKTIYRPNGGRFPENTHSHCAGLLIMLQRAGRLTDNYLLRIAAWLELFDFQKLNLDAPTFTIEELATDEGTTDDRDTYYKAAQERESGDKSDSE